MYTRVSQKNGPSIFKNISWKSGLVHSFKEFLSKLFIKNQIEKCDLPNCFMCIMMKSPFFQGISLLNILLIFSAKLQNSMILNFAPLHQIQSNLFQNGMNIFSSHKTYLLKKILYQPKIQIFVGLFQKKVTDLRY